MKLWQKSLLMLVLGLARLPACAATLQGTVNLPSGLPAKEVKIAIECKGKAQMVLTDSKGHYRAVALPAGTCRVRAVLLPTSEVRSGPFQLEQQEAKTLDLTLQSTAIEFFDQPTFSVAGVTDNTYLGGHGSDTMSRSKEDLTNAAASLHKPMATSPDASEAVLMAKLQREPNNADLHARLADAEERSGHPLEALHHYQRAAELRPTEPRLFDWATELLVHGAPIPASEIFDQGVRRFPESTRMRLGMASAFYSAGNYLEAARRFFQATDLNPSDAGPYLFLAKVQALQIVESAGFNERMARFAKLQPDNAWAHYHYATSLWRRHKDSADPEALAQVQSHLEIALRLDPNFAAAYLRLGIVFAEQGDLNRAISAYQNAIRLNPELPEAHYRLAQAYRETGSAQKAKAETAVFQQLSMQEAQQIDRERSELQKFVVHLKTSAAPQ